jgi:hypothetical protein
VDGSEQAPINIPPYFDRPREAGEVWTLRKGGRVATCHFWTHPAATTTIEDAAAVAPLVTKLQARQQEREAGRLRRLVS